MILIYVVASDQKEAEKLGRLVIETNKAACINIFPSIKSIYWWKDEIQTSEEAVLLIKTEENQFEVIDKIIIENHSYEKPAIFSIKPDNVNSHYLEWLKNQINT